MTIGSSGPRRPTDLYHGLPRHTSVVLLGLVICMVAVLSNSELALAQVLPPPPLPLPFPPFPPVLPEKPPPGLPPSLEVPAPRPPGEPKVIPGIRLFVRQIRIEGNTVFTEEELGNITALYTNRELTTEDLEQLRLTLTLFYVNQGYVTSGALFPEQTVTDGVVTIQIIEGKLASIEVDGTKWFRQAYFRQRLNLSAGPPVNVHALQEQLQHLQTDPRVQRLNAELRPGVVRGESILNVRVTEANPFKASLTFNNYQSPTVGAEQGFVTVSHQNLLGFADTLNLQYGRSAGVHPLLNFRYDLPVTARDTTVSIQYRRFAFAVIEGAFEPLDIRNDAEIFGVSIRQPVYRTLQDEVAVWVAGDYETNETTLLGEPFDLIPGSHQGKFTLAVIRFGQEWVHRTSTQVFSVLSRFSVGIGVLGATTNTNPVFADGRFFAWLGEAQWVRQLPLWRMQLVTRGVLQLSQDHLFPLEQVAVGGRYSVRGYREYTLVQDNAAFGSIETRIPVYTSRSGTDVLYLAPFVDVGRGWETNVPTPEAPPPLLASAGVGLLWNLWPGSHFELYWGKQLNQFRVAKGNLQDHGIHLQLTVQVF